MDEKTQKALRPAACFILGKLTGCSSLERKFQPSRQVVGKWCDRCLLLLTVLICVAQWGYDSDWCLQSACFNNPDLRIDAGDNSAMMERKAAYRPTGLRKASTDRSSSGEEQERRWQICGHGIEAQKTPAKRVTTIRANSDANRCWWSAKGRQKHGCNPRNRSWR